MKILEKSVWRQPEQMQWKTIAYKFIKKSGKQLDFVVKFANSTASEMPNSH